ncbi:(p)ppGpp synthetase [Moraxella caviae]|uniref:(P)ppGpp synthetase n=1 Tax=Moraxella caviae TaxID=34060 RepID=A0A1T0A726_9GAMM|nr:RelA/SpoT domain-containing protein [Moraxella caviae]OOR91379.1 (p)ppGpp synthetase [Moraxella caviae]STZ13964.1 GTP pyrophosphokinase yjbM [Moraxella caviae]VEW12995.1 GTP pyrophosphokinase yjbM [Moraxella caviae]
MNLPSKKQIQKAGKALKKNATGQEYENAMQVLSQWRALHTYPINTFQALLRRKAKKYKNPIIAQRLKRTPSIITKLQRFPNMDLSRMQDIGGLRVIVGGIDDVYHLHKSLMGGKHEPLLPPNDYIKQPKADGYRSLHQVFRYHNSDNPELNDLFVELQIRTKLQHAWATAVETLGIVEKSSLKTGGGSDEIKRFFKLASALFSYHEKQPILAELAGVDAQAIKQELQEIEKRLQIFSKLQGIIITAKQIETNNTSSDYYLMELDSDKGAVNLIAFTKSQMTQAQTLYKAREMDTKDTPNIEVVLIAAGDLKQVKKAYPNYFLDTQDFIKRLNKICATIPNKQTRQAMSELDAGKGTKFDNIDDLMADLSEKPF